MKFRDGFSSPPHIHNVTYRGVVVSGLVHNDDPDAETMWMPPGSFWTQPAGESHITSAKGEENIAYIEIQEGPYLVHPTDQAFDNGERPMNVSSANIVWLNASELTRLDTGSNPETVSIAFLWGDPSGDQPSGAMLKLSEGFEGGLLGNDSWLHAVVIQGKLNYRLDPESPSQELKPGSYFGADSKAKHCLSTESQTLLYIRSIGRFEVSTDRDFE